MVRLNRVIVGLIVCLMLLLSSCAPDPPNMNCGTIVNRYDYYDYYGYYSQIYLNNGSVYNVQYNPNYYYIGRFICF